MSIVLVATRLAAFKMRLKGQIDRENYRRFVKLFRRNPTDDDGDSFREMLEQAVAAEAVAAGVLKSTTDGKFVGSLIDLLTWIIDNWEMIAKIILFIIGLF